MHLKLREHPVRRESGGRDCAIKARHIFHFVAQSRPPDPSGHHFCAILAGSASALQTGRGFGRRGRHLACGCDPEGPSLHTEGYPRRGGGAARRSRVVPPSSGPTKPLLTNPYFGFLQFLAFFCDFVGFVGAMAWPWPSHGPNKSKQITSKG